MGAGLEAEAAAALAAELLPVVVAEAAEAAAALAAELLPVVVAAAAVGAAAVVRCKARMVVVVACLRTRTQSERRDIGGRAPGGRRAPCRRQRWTPAAARRGQRLAPLRRPALRSCDACFFPRVGDFAPAGTDFD